MVNIHQSEAAVKDSPEDVEHEAKICMGYRSASGGLILLMSGALFPGTPAENIDAIIQTLRFSNRFSLDPRCL
jgi:hypothetical protein